MEYHINVYEPLKERETQTFDATHVEKGENSTWLRGISGVGVIPNSDGAKRGAFLFGGIRGMYPKRAIRIYQGEGKIEFRDAVDMAACIRGTEKTLDEALCVLRMIEEGNANVFLTGYVTSGKRAEVITFSQDIPSDLMYRKGDIIRADILSGEEPEGEDIHRAYRGKD